MTGALPAVSALEAADPAPRTRVHHVMVLRKPAMFGGWPTLAGLASARDNDGADSEVLQVVLDTGIAVAAVGGDRARATAG
jgi:hypothetical protein